MPFFEYKCADCEKVFTLLQKRDAERAGHECPECGSTKTERVFSTFAAATGSSGSSMPSGGGGHSCGGGCCCAH